jgi:hypothetical protein
VTKINNNNNNWVLPVGIKKKKKLIPAGSTQLQEIMC